MAENSSNNNNDNNDNNNNNNSKLQGSEVPQKPLPKKLAIIQVPENIPPDSLDYIKENLDAVVEKLQLDGSEIRLLRPQRGGRQKKLLTKEDERAHYREHFKKYYDEKLNKEGMCPHCGKKFKTFTSVGRHIRKSVICKQLREQREEMERKLQEATQGQSATEEQH